MNLPTRQLGRTRLHVTQLGYGSMGLRGPRTWGKRVVDDEDAEKILNAVLDHGINFIDTSPDYGVAEERIGRFLKDRRSEFYLSTKCGCDPVQHDDHLEIQHTWTLDRVKRNLDESLTRLQTTHLDILFFHGGQADELKESGLIQFALDMKSSGVIGCIGVSSKLPELTRMIDTGVFDVIQAPYSCLEPSHGEELQRAHTEGIGIVIRGGIAHGGPDAEIQREHINTAWQDFATRQSISGLTPAQTILRNTLQQSFCDTTIVGTSNLDHLAANVHLATAQAGGQ